VKLELELVPFLDDNVGNVGNVARAEAKEEN